MGIGVAELKARLSAYLDKVKAGEELLITEHGRPVARLVPVRGADEVRDARAQRLMRAGTLAPPRGPMPRALLRRPSGRAGAGEVLDALLDEREDWR